MSYLDNFNYQVLGPEKAPKLVFLHGLMGFSANWRSIAKAFEADYQILLFDQRGHGRSFRPPNGYAPEDYAGDLYKILQELDWDQINLVGHSMGGRNAMSFSVTYPQMLNTLVIEDIGPEANEESFDKISELVNGVPVPFANRQAAREYFTKEFPRIFAHRHKPEALGQYLLSNIAENESGEADWRFSREAILDSVRFGRDKDRWHEIQKIACPTLLIRGELTDELPLQVYERVLQSNSKITGVQISDAAHWVHFDQPTFFIEALKKFLSQYN